MAIRNFNLYILNNTLTYTIDLNPGFTDMENNFSELDVFQGDTAIINFIITSNGLPFNLSGYTISFHGALAPGDALQFNESGTITDAQNGKCQVTLSATDLATPGNYTAQLYLTQNGQTSTVFATPLVIYPSV